MILIGFAAVGAWFAYQEYRRGMPPIVNRPTVTPDGQPITYATRPGGVLPDSYFGQDPSPRGGLTNQKSGWHIVSTQAAPPPAPPSNPIVGLKQ